MSVCTSCPLSLRLSLLLSLSLLRLLLVLTERLADELLELGVLQLLLRLDQLRLVPHWRMGDECRASGEESDGEVECSDEGVCWRVAMWNIFSIANTLITKEMHVHDIVRLDQRMLDCLLETQPRLLLVFENADVEGEGAGLLLHFREDQSRCLHLQLVGDRRVLLVDRGLRVLGTGLLHQSEL